MPILIGTNSTWPLRTTNTPSVSLRVCPGFSSAAAATGSTVRRCRRSVGAFTTCPFSSKTSSRTATAGIGTAVTFFRFAVVMSAVQVKPGRTSGMLSSITTTTLKLVACLEPAFAPVAWIGLFPISVTCPANVLSGSASIETFASWPTDTFGMFVSSTSTSAWMTDMSASVRRTVPALFIVPMTAVSPSWMFRRVTMPSIGDSMRTLLRSYRALSRPARSWTIRASCPATCFSRSLSPDSAARTSLSAFSSVSRVFSC